MEITMFNMDNTDTQIMCYFNVKWDHKWNNFQDNCLIDMENFNQKVNNVLHLKEDQQAYSLPHTLKYLQQLESC